MRATIDLSNRLEPYLGEISSICNKAGVNDEDKTTGDTIYRQDAIDIVRNRVKRFTTACVLAVTEIEKLPSAQPHWIPCSERLPEEDEDVLVCSEEGDIDIACWLPEQWTDEPHIEWWSGEYRVYAVAWMPLPEPYGGEENG